jgi:hypothetical protein
MPKNIQYGKNNLQREHISDVEALLNHEKFKRMITRHMETMRQHCQDYPLMDKDRKVTITLSLKPIINASAKREGIIEYDRAVFSASVGSPMLPSTSVDFNCFVHNGQPYFNIEDGENPLQLTLRDTEMDTDDETPMYPDRKSAVKN